MFNIKSRIKTTMPLLMALGLAYAQPAMAVQETFQGDVIIYENGQGVLLDGSTGDTKSTGSVYAGFNAVTGLGTVTLTGATGAVSATSASLTGAMSAGSAAITNGATVGGDLGVTGASTLTGNTTVGGTLGVTGATTLSGTLGVTGAATFSNASVGGTLGVTGASTLGSTSASTLSVTGASTLTGNTTVGGTFGVTGASILGSTSASTLSVTGASTLTGNTTVGGTLGVTGAATAGSVSSPTVTLTSGGGNAVLTTNGGSLLVNGNAITQTDITLGQMNTGDTQTKKAISYKLGTDLANVADAAIETLDLASLDPGETLEAIITEIRIANFNPIIRIDLSAYNHLTGTGTVTAYIEDGAGTGGVDTAVNITPLDGTLIDIGSSGIAIGFNPAGSTEPNRGLLRFRNNLGTGGNPFGGGALDRMYDIFGFVADAI